MKVILLLAVMVTFAAIFLQYFSNKNLKKLLIALATFGVIISLSVVGNITRQVFPLFLSHIILVVISWGALVLYLIRDRYYWWMIFSPLVTIGLFLLLELVVGSGHGDL